MARQVVVAGVGEDREKGRRMFLSPVFACLHSMPLATHIISFFKPSGFWIGFWRKEPGMEGMKC